MACAPRILNAPTGWRFSGLSQIVSSQESSGVRRATPRMRSAASRMRSRVTRVASAVTELVELVGVLLEVIHDEPIEDLRGRHLATRRMETARAPGVGREGVEVRNSRRDPVSHLPEQRLGILVPVPLDGGDPRRI